MRTASNSPLTQKYGDKTTHVSITVLFVLKLIGSPVLTQLRTGPKKCRFSIPIGKQSRYAGDTRNCVVPKHATARCMRAEEARESASISVIPSIPPSLTLSYSTTNCDSREKRDVWSPFGC